VFESVLGRGLAQWLKGFEDILFKRWARQGGTHGKWPCVLRKEERARVGSRNGIQESAGFSKKNFKSAFQ
jgi:hypothetical protein